MKYAITLLAITAIQFSFAQKIEGKSIKKDSTIRYIDDAPLEIRGSFVRYIDGKPVNAIVLNDIENSTSKVITNGDSLLNVARKTNADANTKYFYEYSSCPSGGTNEVTKLQKPTIIMDGLSNGRIFYREDIRELASTTIIFGDGFSKGTQQNIVIY